MSDEIRSVSATGGEKGVKLARYDLIPAEPLRRLAEMFGKGAEKYADRNWERGYEWSKSFAALQRHAWTFWNGQDLDEHEADCPADCKNHTELPHLASVAWHAFALLEFVLSHPEFDDRPTTQAGRSAVREAMRAQLVRGIEEQFAEAKDHSDTVTLDLTSSFDANGQEWIAPRPAQWSVHSPDGTSHQVDVPPVQRWHE